MKNRWDVVTIHYNQTERKRYRAVEYNAKGVIINERTFNTIEFAKEYARNKQKESNGWPTQ